MPESIPAAACIDFSIPTPSIFGRKKPLAEKTCRRIAKGVVRYIIESNTPFLVPAFITECAHSSSDRNMSIDTPLRTQCAAVKGGHFALVTAFLAKHYGGVIGHGVERSLGTVTAVDHHSLVACTLTRHFGESAASDIQLPMPTVMSAGGGKTQLVSAYISKIRGTNIGSHADTPLHTITASGGHHALVHAFMTKYYGGGDSAHSLSVPAPTITSRGRFGIVTVQINGDTYVIEDIGLRMLQPKELYAAQGFPAEYIIDRGHYSDGTIRPFSKTLQVHMCGNSVSPPNAETLIRANLPELATESIIWKKTG